MRKLGFLSVLLSIVILCSPMLAQSPERTASITFQVKDQSGAVIPNAHMRIVPYQTTSKIRTDLNGKVTLRLTPGNFEIFVNFPGFKPHKSEFVLSDPIDQTIPIVMIIGSVGGGEVSPISPLAYSADEEELSKLEDFYWKKVESFDIDGYKRYWHPDAIAWSDFSEASGMNSMADWFTMNHSKGLRLEEFFSGLEKTRVLGGTGVTFCRVTALWVDSYSKGEPVTIQVSHTWRKVGKDWQIVGEMSTQQKYR
jgi:hypothetical protein